MCVIMCDTFHISYLRYFSRDSRQKCFIYYINITCFSKLPEAICRSLLGELSLSLSLSLSLWLYLLTCRLKSSSVSKANLVLLFIVIILFLFFSGGGGGGWGELVAVLRPSSRLLSCRRSVHLTALFPGQD